MSDEQGNGSKWAKITQIIMTGVAITAIPWCIWVTSRIHSMDLSIAKLETFASAGGRFTSEHGQALRLEIQAQTAAESAKIWQELANIQNRWLKEISAINTQMATLPQTLQLPPRWWEEYVRNEFNNQDKRISLLESKVITERGQTNR
jgi:hypothetical protein